MNAPNTVSRGLALIIDAFVLIAIGFTLSAVLELVGRHHNAERLMVIVLSVLWLPYSVTMLAKTGTTLGKRLVGIRVVAAETGSALGWRGALRREIWRVVLAAGILWPVDYLAAFFGRKRMPIHDRWSSTVVISDRPRARRLVPGLVAVGLFVVIAAMQYLSHYIARH